MNDHDDWHLGRVWEGEGIAVLGGKIGKFGDCSLLFLF